MQSRDLSRAQAARIAEDVRVKLDYLRRLRDRMERSGFPPQDRLYIATNAAFNSMHELFNATLRVGRDNEHGVNADPDTREKDRKRA